MKKGGRARGTRKDGGLREKGEREERIGGSGSEKKLRKESGFFAGLRS